MRVLGQTLEDNESVLFVYERNMRWRRVLFYLSAMILLLIGGLALRTYIVPILMFPLSLLCIHRGRKPSRSMSVGWVLTDRRLLTIYYVDHEPPEVLSTAAIVQVVPIRKPGADAGGTSVIADIVVGLFSFFFNMIRDAIQDRHEATSPKYWAQADGILIHYDDGSQISFRCGCEKVVVRIGVILATILKDGPKGVTPLTGVPATRRDSR